MTGLERDIKYWLFYICKVSLTTFAMIIGIVAVMSFADGSGFVETFFSTLPLYLILMCTLMVIVNGFTNITVVFPITVSFGSRRKTSVYGMAIANHIINLVCWIIALISLYYAYPEYRMLMPGLWPVFIAIFCFMMFLGNLVAVFSNRFGRTAGMVVYIAFVILLTMAVVMFVGNQAILETVMTAAMINFFGLGIVIALVCVALDALSVWLLYRGVAKKDLSF